MWTVWFDSRKESLCLEEIGRLVMSRPGGEVWNQETAESYQEAKRQEKAQERSTNCFPPLISHGQACHRLRTMLGIFAVEPGAT